MNHVDSYRAGFQGRPLPPGGNVRSWQIGRARATASQIPERGAALPSVVTPHCHGSSKDALTAEPLYPAEGEPVLADGVLL